MENPRRRLHSSELRSPAKPSSTTTKAKVREKGKASPKAAASCT